MGQAIMNIAMVTGLLPIIGVPLPFISAGGSALMMSILASGVVLSFATHQETNPVDHSLIRLPEVSGHRVVELRM